MKEDIRWMQRFQNYLKALRELEDAVRLSATRDLNKLEKQGLIQGFEYTHELAWKTIKDYLSEQGISGLVGSKDSSREAFNLGLISDGAVWMEMIKARNLTSHAYDEHIAETVFKAITEQFFPVFYDFTQHFLQIHTKELNEQ